MSKYKITEIEHPKYPWLHRIQALIDVNEKVPEGTLGGFVENENNLSQEGTCWIYDDAICCENGEVKEEAALYDGSLVRGYAVVTGDATFYDRAVAKRDCYICGGEIKENAIISGKAFIDTVGVNAPVIGGESHVYGEVRGNIYIKGDIFPWDIFNNHTKDMYGDGERVAGLCRYLDQDHAEINGVKWQMTEFAIQMQIRGILFSPALTE